MYFTNYDRIIYHIDVNSAFLSWEACRRLAEGASLDLRTIPSVVGGDQKKRHGIVLAKSIPAKAYHIQTGEPLVSAREKCPGLTVVPPHYPMYVEASKAFIALLRKYAPSVEQYSIDEAFCDMSHTVRLYGSPVVFAHQLKDEIRDTLGFTVNIGVSSNKLLAKMASDFEKPDKVHTLFPEEIPDKLWPLPVGDLFFVGRSTKRTLQKLGIRTIGELANTEPAILQAHLKKHGLTIWNHANGIDTAAVTAEAPANKSYGNSVTTGADVVDTDTAREILLSLCETVGARLRADHAKAGLVSVSVKDCDFHYMSHQRVLLFSTDATMDIYEAACFLFDDLWDHTPLRQLGVATARITTEDTYQYSLFDQKQHEKRIKADAAIDEIRARYGEDAIMRARFVNNERSHMSGGLDKSRRTGVTKEVK